MKELTKSKITKHIDVSSEWMDLTVFQDVSVDVDSNIQTLRLRGNNGKGYVKNVDFNNGMAVTQYDLKLYDDFSFTLQKEAKDYLYFLYSVDGDFYQNFETNEKQVLVEELRTTIVGSIGDTKCVINLQKNKHYRFSLISIDRVLYFEKIKERFITNDKDLYELLDALDTVKNKVYKCAFNLKIADQLRLLESTKLEFKINNLQHFEGHFQIILSKYLEQFCSEIYGERIETSLNKTELQKIRKITDYIIDKPMLQHTIKNLCDRSQLSPAKLQEGFKCVHKTTVSNYIKNIRVEKSRDLLIYTDYNVSEIAYMVGFTSRSYFCKIFKEKYSYNATAYRSKYKEKGVNLSKL
ncbi:helix-turn-helix domain-containing protein [Hyunsoonleella sp. 2307UL5-6]|uniref:helix-turn-helix domain-containing protein n=1 Tax=Hyunsoonleella sp. 2307UL5-6 TaxID=3384768 RepID=UPI0039BD81CA